MRKRSLFGIALGAMLGAVMLLSFPAGAEALDLNFTAIHATAKASVPQPNFSQINTASQANHATASASESRPSSAAGSADPDYNGPSFSVIALAADPVTGAQTRPYVALRIPGDDEGEGIGAYGPDIGDHGEVGDGEGDGLTPLT